MLSVQIASACSFLLWESCKSGEILTFLESIWKGKKLSDPGFAKLYIAEAETGNIDSNKLHSAIQWWERDENGFRDSSRPTIIFDEENPIYVKSYIFYTPWITFYYDGDRVLIGEHYGPGLSLRRVAKFEAKQNQVFLSNFKLIWKSDPPWTWSN